jgi:hypothetical protein
MPVAELARGVTKMKTLARSWQIAKISFAVIQDDPKLTILPVLALLSSGLLIVAFALPAFFFDAPSEDLEQVALYATAFAIYFGLSFVATFFNTCVVYMARGHFEGRQVSIGSSLGFALSRFRLVLGWALVAASVGVVFKMLDQLAERMGPLGRIVLGIVHLVFGVAWSLIALLGIPAMVYHDLGPIEAVRHSARLLERTWGDGLMLEVGLGVIQFGLVIAGLAAVVGLFTVTTDSGARWVIGGLALFYFVAIGAVFNLAGTIFGTALFVYADTGTLPAGYTSDLLDDVIRSRR